MSEKIISHVYIVSTIFFTVYSQLIMRWQVQLSGSLPTDWGGKIFFVLNLFFNPWILSGIIATFLAGVSWMLAMSKFELSYAYPFVSLNYVIVFVAGLLFFNETITLSKIIGSLIVITGIIVLARG